VRWLMLICLGAFLTCGPLSAAAPTDQRAQPQKSAPAESRLPSKTAAPAMTAAREAAAMTFARLHHRELADLLSQLSRTNPREYERAIRQLFQASERLARLQERSTAERYDAELEAWKLDSRLRLLAARLTMSDDPALEAELKAALRKRDEIRLELLRLERERLAERLTKLDAQIESISRALEAGAENVSHQDFDRLKMRLQSARLRNKNPLSPAGSSRQPAPAK
jgi:hypothetical protein